MRDWDRAETAIRASDFDAAASSLLGPSRPLRLESFFKNTPSHDLMYSTPPRGAAVPPAELRAWKTEARRRRSAALWTLAGAAEMAAGRAAAAEAALTRALALDPALAAASLARAAVRLSLSRAKRDNRLLPGCLDDLDRAVALAPDDPRALRLRAELGNDCDDLDGARRDLERALALDPENGWARAELADLFCDAGEFEKARPLMNSLAPKNGGEGWYWALRGRALALSGKSAEGLRALEKAVALSPRLASAVGWRGEAYRRAGRYREALRDLDRSLALDPGFVYAYEWRSRLRLMLGEPRKALADAERIVRRDARHRYGPALRGEALFKLGRFAAAAADFDRVYPLDASRTWNPVVTEGQLTSGEERDAAFRRDVDQALAKHPRSAAAWTLAGRFLGAAGRREEALAALTRAASLANAPKALAWRGRVRLDAGEAAAALSDLKAALRLAPADARARCWKAEALLALGDERKAMAEYGRALSRPSAPAFGFLARAALRARAGDWAKARADYAAAFALDVKSAAARLGLAECRRRLGTGR